MGKAIIFDWTGTLYEGDKGLFPFTKEVLEKLKNMREQGIRKYRLGLITTTRNGIETRQQKIDPFGVLYYLDSLIIDTQKTKEHYLQCMGELGSTPETTMIVDDRTVRGIKIGNELGCKTFWIQRGEYANELPDEETGEPTHRIGSVEDLLKFL